jgi:hypothetical protein
MSMIGNLARIQDETRLKLQQSPESITSLLYPDVPLAKPAKPGLLSRLFGKPKSPPPAKSPATAPSILPSDMMDLDKAWHGLHFVFTGSDWEGDFPQGFLVSCGKPVGDVDVGYGPARAFTPDEVVAIARFLESQNESELKRRLDPKKMAELEIYPSIWSDATNTNEEWEYLVENFRTLKSFVKETAEKRMALLVFIN